MRDRLSDWTTFGIGGRAKRIVLAHSREALVDLAQDGLVLGCGSNVLASDDGYDGTVVINRYGKTDIRGNVVTVGSGARITALCEALAEVGLTGLEFAVGIPATVGGAVRMNAGAFGGQISDRLLYADVLRHGGRVERLGRDELDFGYRHSGLLPTDTVLDVAFELGSDSPSAVRARCRELSALRRSKQPVGKSAGSVFKNPEGISVGKLFDEAGLKGTRIGGAVISPMHANMIVNTGGATARDVCALISVMKSVLEDRGIDVREEIIYIGGSFNNGVLG